MVEAKRKEMFLKAIARYQNFSSHTDTKIKLLEKAFGDDTQIFDYEGLETLRSATIDIILSLFPNTQEKYVEDDLTWWLYECLDFEEASQFIERNGTKYPVRNSEELYEYFKSYD